MLRRISLLIRPIREYSGPVDLLAPHLAGVDAVILHLAPLSRKAVAAAERLQVVGCARGGAINLNMESPQRARHSGLRLPGAQCPGGG